MKDWKLYILNAFLLFIVGYHILPDFSLQKKDFEKVSGILSLVKIETVNDGRSKDYFYSITNHYYIFTKNIGMFY